MLSLGAALFALGVAAGLLNWSVVRLCLLAAGYLVLGLPILKTAGKNLFKGRLLDENFLMAIATIGAICIGEYAEAVGVMLFYRVGEYFEHKASDASRKNILQALDLRPETVTLESGAVIPAAQAKPGDVLLIRPGDRIPLDGRVLKGESRVDTAPVTGESVPVAVCPGSSLISGCVNGAGLLIMEAEKPLSQSMVTRILESVEQAAASKPKMDRFITQPGHGGLGLLGVHGPELSGHELPLRAGDQRAAGLLLRHWRCWPQGHFVQRRRGHGDPGGCEGGGHGQNRHLDQGRLYGFGDAGRGCAFSLRHL